MADWTGFIGEKQQHVIIDREISIIIRETVNLFFFLPKMHVRKLFSTGKKNPDSIILIPRASTRKNKLIRGKSEKYNIVKENSYNYNVKLKIHTQHYHGVGSQHP